MKKSALTFILLASLSFSYGQETIFLETCGNTDVTSPKKVDIYTGWDNSSQVTFSRTTSLDGFADVRSTNSTTNHVWFPADKSSDLIISNIVTANYHHLKLSFDIAAYKLNDANLNKLTIYFNDKLLILPSMAISTQKFMSVTDITLTDSKIMTLKFHYSANDNTSGYRLDNFMITGEKSISEVYNPTSNNIHPIISGSSLRFPTLADGTMVEIFDLLGTQVQLSALHNGSIEFTNKLKKFMYLVRVNNRTFKIIL